MFRFLAAVLLLILTAPNPAATAGESGAPVTRWSVTAAAGMDALLLIGAAGGDVMQSEIYTEEIAYVRSHISEAGIAAIDQLDLALRQQMGQLTGPALAHVFSAGPIASIEDIIESAENPLERLKPGLQRSPHWDEQAFAEALALMPTVRTALVALRDMGFNEWYQETQQPHVDKAIAGNLAAITPYDIIPEQARLLGRPLDPTVEVVVVAFARPYGIRILGQRFVAWYGWRGETQLRIAAHEIFHPPFRPDDEELKSLLVDLENDPWMRSIVDDHDPKYGYNSFMAVIDEDSSQALDQVVATRLGFAQVPGERWRESDGGMHMLAAALFHAMQEDGFVANGGEYAAWFKSALRRGLLSPEEVRRRAAAIVGRAAVDAWQPGSTTESREQ